MKSWESHVQALTLYNISVWGRVWNSLIHGLNNSFLTPPATINTVYKKRKNNNRRRINLGKNIFTISQNSRFKINGKPLLTIFSVYYIKLKYLNF